MDGRHDFDVLTAREREVLALANEGRTNNEIAHELGITRNAVRFHLKEIHSKLGTGGERWRLGAWLRGIGLAALPLSRAGTAIAVTAVTAVLAGGGYLAYRERPRDALAAPGRFEGTVVVDGTTASAESAQYVVSVSPPDGASIATEATRWTDEPSARGVCVSVRFDAGQPATGQWFRMSIDGADVTPQLSWFLPQSRSPRTGRLCFATESGLATGSHVAAVSVRDPEQPAPATLQTVRWSFTVTP